MELRTAALELLRKEIRESTSSMTSVPKPLKFLAEHWDNLRALYTATPDAGAGAEAAFKRAFADVMSVLAMTMAKEPRASLKYKLAGDVTDIGGWGHEYVRHLSGMPLLHRPAPSLSFCFYLHNPTRLLASKGSGESRHHGRHTRACQDVTPAAPTHYSMLLPCLRPAGEIGTEYNERREANAAADVADLLALVRLIVPFDMAHNAEAEAVDLLLETGQLRMLTEPGVVEEGTHARVCRYLIKCGDYLGDDDEVALALTVAYTLFMSHKQYVDAVRLALRMGGSNEEARIREVFAAASGDDAVRKQLAYVLGRHRSSFVAQDADLDALIGNNTLSALFAELARDLDVVEAKTPEDIYKTHLAGGVGRRDEGPQPESARANLASTFVNAFVNAGYQQDKLITTKDSTWVYKNREHAMMSAVASVGMVHMWNPDEGLNAVSKYLDAPEEYVRAGALLGVGVACAGTRNLDVDPALAVFSDHIVEGSKSGHNMKLAALQGLGLAYAGSKRSEIAEFLVPYIQDESASKSMELAAIAGTALGLVFVGTGNDEYATVILDRLMSLDDAEAAQAITRHLALGLGLLLLGRAEEADPTLEVLSTIEKPIGQQASLLVQACAYAGTGNVLQVQKLLRVCATHPEGEDREKAEKAKAEAGAGAPGAAAGGAGSGAAAGAGAGAAGRGGSGGAASGPSTGAAGGAGASAGADSEAAGKGAKDVAGKYIHQSVAVLGLALVAMGEELSIDMASRMADHLLQYGDTAVRRAVPLSLALCHISDPEYSIVDVLSKLTHDQNDETAQAAIFSLGLVRACVY